MGKIELLRLKGNTLQAPHVKHLRGKLWELRVKAVKKNHRIIYFMAKEQKIVFLHAFIKKTKKTLKKEIDLAEERMNWYIERVGK